MKKIKIELSFVINNILKSLSYPDVNFSLAPPKNSEFGDLSSNIALLLTKDIKKQPMEIADIFKNKIEYENINYIINVTVTEPGFLNFKISNQYFQSQVKIILKNLNTFGKSNIGSGKHANVEFVSANPTGPLTVGHGRNAIIGDTISNLLIWNGFKVTREYYFNDAGRQMRILAESVEARYFQIIKNDFPFPKEGYQGDYIKDIAESIFQNKGDQLQIGATIFKKEAEKVIFKDIKKSLRKLGIHFNQYTNEKTFYDNGSINELLAQLREKNLIYEKDDATWFRASALGKEKDRVYIKSSGEPTYRVPDTAYHRDKINRKFDLIIDVFGADHADTYPDVLLALEALGYDTGHIKVLLYQFVTLLSGGKKIKMSTRKADYVTLDELVDKVGDDVVRYFFIMRSMNTHLDFDLDLASDQSDKNPVFYLQYAHARICNIIYRAKDDKILLDDSYDASLLNHIDEIQLIKYMTQFPEIIEIAYINLEPQIIANYLQDLSSYFHKFYNHCRVITNNIELTKSRIALVKAVKVILKNGFSILGISAPERM